MHGSKICFVCQRLENSEFNICILILINDKLINNVIYWHPWLQQLLLFPSTSCKLNNDILLRFTWQNYKTKKKTPNKQQFITAFFCSCVSGHLTIESPTPTEGHDWCGYSGRAQRGRLEPFFSGSSSIRLPAVADNQSARVNQNSTETVKTPLSVPCSSGRLSYCLQLVI